MPPRKRKLDSTTTAAAAAASLNGSAPPAVRRRLTKLTQAEEFSLFFRDPPNLDDLHQVRDGHGEDDLGTGSLEDAQYSGLEFNGSDANTRRIYVAVNHLKHHMWDWARLDNDEFEFDMSAEGAGFKAMAEELERKKPLLKGVSGSALCTMYEELVQKHRELANLVTRTGEGNQWTSTRLSKMSWDLVMMDAMIQQRRERQTEKEQTCITDREVQEDNLIIASLEMRPRKRAVASSSIFSQEDKRGSAAASRPIRDLPLVPPTIQHTPAVASRHTANQNSIRRSSPASHPTRDLLLVPPTIQHTPSVIPYQDPPSPSSSQEDPLPLTFCCDELETYTEEWRKDSETIESLLVNTAGPPSQRTLGQMFEKLVVLVRKIEKTEERLLPANLRTNQQ
ncbi:hypothetical protein B0O80DRAFT_429785 [Mortierella sp. GBAus27b]|nr:hypothetical protein BGX31_011375 [Mortierella sp. GBA43]KAI8348061.1 hypothetical protein B0O80DRAFT_429785 [Mortierella sp. GBAus27b]